MAEIDINIGGRVFPVSCQEGEEHFLQSAAALLNAEASVLTSQIGRIPETRMLLMSGLMLADRTAGLEEQLRDAERKLGERDAMIEELNNRPAPVAEIVETVPAALSGALADLAGRAEAIADQIDEKSA